MDFCHCPVNNSVLFLIVCQNPLCCCLVAKLSLTLWPHELQYTRLPCLSLSPGVCWNSFLLSQWCHPTILFSVVPFSSCPQSFPASRSFPMSQLFASGGQNIRASPSVSVLPVNIQGWFPLGLTGFISLLSRGTLKSLIQYCSSKASILWCSASSWSNSHIYTWLLEKP